MTLRLSGDLSGRIRGELRRRLSPRHVPDVIEGVPGIPQTLTGKKLTIEVVESLLREVLHEEGRFSISIEVIQKRINREIDEAIQIAEKDPFPEPEDCLRDVYYEGQ